MEALNMFHPDIAMDILGRWRGTPGFGLVVWLPLRTVIEEYIRDHLMSPFEESARRLFKDESVITTLLSAEKACEFWSTAIQETISFILDAKMNKG